MVNALDLIDETIADLEAKLGLKPGQSLPSSKGGEAPKKKNEKKKKQPNNNNNKKPPQSAPPTDQPDICKLDFRVGVITKVWVHPDADKLYCEEIDIGEKEGPRRIASGLRPHFTLEQMMGQRLLVVANLKAKNLVGFKSHGMVLCAANGDDTKVEFVEPPPEAPIGESVTFEGLPKPQPFSPSQVDKKKVFPACLKGMTSTDECLAAWNGHVFVTTAGPCRVQTIANGNLR